MGKAKETGGTPQLITVGLYGDGSRDARLRAEYVSCDRAGICSAYSNGKCFGVTTLFGDLCPYAKVNKVDGGLKRSKAYGRVYSEAKNNDKYSALGYPYHTLATKIGDEAFITVPYVQLEYENGHITVHDPIVRRAILLPAELLTPENLEKICSFVPLAMMGGVIKDYQEKIVPMLLLELSRLFPEQYRAFIEAYPEYAERKPDWTGRLAQLNTCNREQTYQNGSGDVFRFEGDYIVGVCKSVPFAPFGTTPTELRVKVTDDMTVKITDNAQVLDTTVFR